MRKLVVDRKRSAIMEIIPNCFMQNLWKILDNRIVLEKFQIKVCFMDVLIRFNDSVTLPLTCDNR